ncbi:MAG TPA: ankyrin repeat domain-containing protein [Anaerovoracaceae bacterium]|nr:ankyrin repeat domain-containing protein [Anaerovoracaceae bacterium]
MNAEQKGWLHVLEKDFRTLDVDHVRDVLNACVKCGADINEVNIAKIINDEPDNFLNNSNSDDDWYHIDETINMMELFYEYGYNFDGLEVDGKPILNLLIGNSLEHEDFIERLISGGAKLDGNIVDDDGYTPLHEATRDPFNDPLVELLLDSGAEVDAQNIYQSTPLILACCHGSIYSAKLLVEHGANVNLADDDGETPLMGLARCGADEDVVMDGMTVLLNAGADIHAQDKYGNTALHKAVFMENKLLVRFLLEHGADWTIKDVDGNSALDLAEEVADRRPEIRDIIKTYDERKRLEATLKASEPVAETKKSKMKI